MVNPLRQSYPCESTPTSANLAPDDHRKGVRVASRGCDGKTDKWLGVAEAPLFAGSG